MAQSPGDTPCLAKTSKPTKSRPQQICFICFALMLCSLTKQLYSQAPWPSRWFNVFLVHHYCNCATLCGPFWANFELRIFFCWFHSGFQSKHVHTWLAKCLRENRTLALQMFTHTLVSTQIQPGDFLLYCQCLMLLKYLVFKFLPRI